jgi:hypothetical protein
VLHYASRIGAPVTLLMWFQQRSPEHKQASAPRYERLFDSEYDDNEILVEVLSSVITTVATAPAKPSRKLRCSIGVSQASTTDWHARGTT